MLHLSLALFLLSSPATAAPTAAERTAELDAAETFRALEVKVAELDGQNWDSLARFRELSSEVEGNIAAYCKSMARFPAIQIRCRDKAEIAKVTLAAKDQSLEKDPKEDRYGAFRLKLEAFEERYRGLRSVQPDGEAIALDKLREESQKLAQEMKTFCAPLSGPEYQPACSETTVRLDTYFNEYLINRSFVGEPRPVRTKKKKAYRDTSPVLRCFPQFPLSLSRPEDYVITDLFGAYRYSDMKKSEYGYAIEVPMKDFVKTNVNETRQISKNYRLPNAKESYQATIVPQHSCRPDGASPPNCYVRSLSIYLTFIDKNGAESETNSSHSLQPDVFFSSAIKTGAGPNSDFGLECMVASKVRLGGWMFSDEGFDE